MSDGAVPLAVLVSGSGTNLQAILDAAASDPDFGARIVVVIADRPDTGGVARAAAAGVPAEVVAWEGPENRAAFTKAVCAAAHRHGAAALVLAGFMRVLSPEAMESFPGAILNIHPSLLPSFPGAHAVRDALAHGVKVSGVTVHFVDEQVDHGPIIAQRPVPVEPDDTEASLHARIQAEEHELYPEVVKAFAHDLLAVEGRAVTWRTGP